MKAPSKQVSRIRAREYLFSIGASFAHPRWQRVQARCRALEEFHGEHPGDCACHAQAAGGPPYSKDNLFELLWELGERLASEQAINRLSGLAGFPSEQGIIRGSIDDCCA